MTISLSGSSAFSFLNSISSWFFGIQFWPRKALPSESVTRTATTCSIDETFDIGLDTGSSPADYRAPFPFTGTLERVDVELL
jgi:hypothetical protein